MAPSLPAPPTCSPPASIRRTCRAIRWRVNVARYAGEWVAAVVADTRALAEDAAEAVAVEYEPLPFVLDADEAYAGGTLVHEAHGSNVLLDRTFVWGEVEKDFAASPHKLQASRQMGPQLDGADRDLRRDGELGPVARNPRHLGLDPDAEISRPDRDGAEDSDVVGARALRRRRRRQLRRQARHQAHRAGRLSVEAARRAGAADRGPPGEHARRRHARAGAHLRCRGGVRRPGHHPLDEDARARQRRRLCRALAVPARQAGRRHRRAVQDQERAVPGHRRGHQQDGAGGGARLRPVADQLRHRAHRRRGGEPARPRPARSAPAQHDPPRRISVSDPERLDLRQRRLSHRHRQGAGARRLRRADRRARPAARRRACSPASASPRAWSRPAAIRRSSRCSIPRSAPPPGWIPAASASIWSARSPRPCTPPRPGRATRPWSARWSARCWRSIPTRCAWCGRTRSIHCRATARSAAAWRSCSAARRSTRRSKLKDKLIAIAAHDLGVPVERIAYKDGNAFDTSAPDKKRTWAELVTIAHRHIHKLPAGMEPGLSVSHIMPVPMGGGLPTADGRVQMYPCYSFEFHLMLVDDRSRSRQARDQALHPRPRLRHGDQSEDRARHDHGRHRPRHRRGALRGVRLQRRRPAGGAEFHGLPAAVGARGAAGRDRPSRDAVAAHRVRPEGLGRERLSRRAGRGRERGQRRGAAARHRGQLASYQSGAAWRYDRAPRARKRKAFEL